MFSHDQASFCLPGLNQYKAAAKVSWSKTPIQDFSSAGVPEK